MDLLKNIAMLDKMYEKNMEYYQRLELYIKVGEETLEYMKLQVIPGAQDKASASGNPMDQENVQKKQGMANDLERRVYQLKLARAMALQTGPQIRLLQTNSRSQADQIQQTLTTMIPSWEKRLATELNGYT